jgi:hypothetical protein
MSNYVKVASEAAEQYLTALAETQEQYLKYAKTFSAWVPPAPAMPTGAQDYLPTPKEVLEANFAFVTKLLKQQKTFTDKLIATSTAAS